MYYTVKRIYLLYTLITVDSYIEIAVYPAFIQIKVQERMLNLAIIWLIVLWVCGAIGPLSNTTNLGRGH